MKQNERNQVSSPLLYICGAFDSISLSPFGKKWKISDKGDEDVVSNQLSTFASTIYSIAKNIRQSSVYNSLPRTHSEHTVHFV